MTEVQKLEEDQFAKDYRRYLRTIVGYNSFNFDQDNPHVWILFTRFAHEARTKGRTKFSAKAIIERCRWELNFETNDIQFKLNNNYTSYYARKLMAENPLFHNFFEIRG